MSIRIAILCVCFLGAAAYLAGAVTMEPDVVRQSLVFFPSQVGDWYGQEAPLERRIVEEAGVDDYLNRYYKSGANVVAVYIGYYQSQRQGKNIHSPLNCLPGAGWNPASRSAFPIRLSPAPGSEGTHQIEVNRLTIQKGTERQVVLYWYQGRGRVVASEYWGKVYTVLDAMRINRTDAAMIRIVSPIQGLDGDSERAAEAAAVNFAQSAYPLLVHYLPE
jgi:EpsI family protein